MQEMQEKFKNKSKKFVMLKKWLER